MADKVAPYGISGLVTGNPSPDIETVKGDVRALIEQGADDSEIDNYLQGAGVTPEQLRAPSGFLDTATDMAKSLGSGIVKGVESAGTFPMQIGDFLAEKAISGIEALRGTDPAVVEKNKQAARQMLDERGIGPQKTFPAISEAIGGNYEPQSVAGQYSKTVGEFAPAAVAGPGKFGQKMLSTTTAGLNSEWAGQMAQQYWPAAEPYARLIGSVVGGAVPTALAERPNKLVQSTAPSMDEVRSLKNAKYQSLENAGVKYDSYAYAQWVADLERKLKGIDPILHPQANAVLGQIKKQVGNSPDFTTMENLRKIAGETTRGGAGISPADMDRAGVILKEIDQFYSGAPLISNGSVPAGRVASTAKEARELARRNIIGRDIEEMSRKANQGYVSGSESGTRNQFASYMRSPKGKLLTPEEQAAFGKVVRREGLEGVLHNHGSRLAQIAGTGGGIAAGAATANPLIGAGVWAGTTLANMGARKLSEVATDKKVREALKVVLAGKTAQQAGTAATKQLSRDQTAALVRALLASQMGHGSLVPAK